MGRTVTRLKRQTDSLQRDLAKLAKKLGMGATKGKKKSSRRKKRATAKTAPTP